MAGKGKKKEDKEEYKADVNAAENILVGAGLEPDYAHNFVDRVIHDKHYDFDRNSITGPLSHHNYTTAGKRFKAYYGERLGKDYGIKIGELDDYQLGSAVDKILKAKGHYARR